MGRLFPEAGLLRYRNQQQAVLDALANAYALAVIAQHTTTKVIDDLINRIWAHRRDLCDDLSQHSADLANAIDLPDQPAEATVSRAFRNALM